MSTSADKQKPAGEAKRKDDLWLLAHSASGAFRMATQLVVMMIFVPIIIHYVGEEQYGVWTIAMAIVGVLIFMEFGLVQASNRFLSSLDFRRDPDKIREMACTSFWLTSISGALVVTVGVLFTEEIARLLGIPDEIQGEAAVVIGIFIWRQGVSVPLRIFNTLLISQRLMARAHFTQGFFTIAYFVVGLAFLSQGQGLSGLALVYLGAMLAEHAVYAYLSREILPLSAYLPGNFRPKLVPKLLEFALFAWLGQFSTVMFMRAGVFLVQIWSGLVATAAFGIASRLSTISAELAAQVVYAGGPKIAKLAAGSPSERKEAGWLTLSLARRALLLSAPLAAVAIPLGEIFLYGWVGEELAIIAAAPLALLATDIALSVPVKMAMNSLALSGDHRWVNLMSTSMVLLYLPLVAFGAYYHGPAGAASAGLVLTIIFGVPVYLMRVSRQLDISPWHWWWKVYRYHLPPFLLCLGGSAACAWLVKSYILPGKVWLLAGLGFGALNGTLYILVYLLASAPKSERKSIRRLIAKIRKK